MFPNNPQQPNQSPVDPYQAQPPVQSPAMQPPERPKNKKKLLVILMIAAIAIIAGILLWVLVFSSSDKSNTENSSTSQTNKSQNSSGLDVDCDGNPSPDIGQWQEYFVSRVGAHECGYKVSNLRTALTDASGSNAFAIQVWVDSQMDPPQPGHDVSITNVEFHVREDSFKLADHVRSDAEMFGEGSQYLKDARVSFDDAKVMNGAMWQRAFGEHLAIDDMFQAFSPTGNSFRIAPAYTAEECPDCLREQDARREVRFAVNEQREIRAVKFDLTIDGVKKTVAYATAW